MSHTHVSARFLTGKPLSGRTFKDWAQQSSKNGELTAACVPCPQTKCDFIPGKSPHLEAEFADVVEGAGGEGRAPGES